MAEERVDKRQPDQTRERLLAAGLNLLAKSGYRGATTREIALEAGVTEVTMYRHFRSKEDLFAAAITKHSEQLLELVPDPSGDIESDFMILATALRKHVSSVPTRLLRITPELKQHPKLKKLIRDIMSRFKEKTVSLFHYYQENGELTTDIDDLMYISIVGPIYFSSLDINSGIKFDCRSYVRLFLEGFSNKKK